MRVVQWHGWLLEGSGSNIYTARVTESMRRAGHDVLLLCQEPSADRYAFVDAVGVVSADGVAALRETGAPPGSGRVVVLRPEIGSLLPVFVLDEYPGFEVKRFVDLSDGELQQYLRRNVEALRAAVRWHRADVVITGHAIPGAVIGRRALGPGRYVAKVHGSDIEYAIRIDERYRALAREGLADAAAVAGPSDDVLGRVFEFVPEARPRAVLVTPGVDAAFRPRSRADGLHEAAAALERDPALVRGRQAGVTEEVRRALGAREPGRVDALARAYDQEAPDPDAPARLRSLARTEGPIVGYLGKLIPQKGVHLLIQALCLLPGSVRGLVVGFGTFREWLHALVIALDTGDPAAVRWIADRAEIALELTDREIADARGLADRVTFTGRLDHRYAPGALAAMDVLAVPSVLEEAFGMVAVEGAASGAVPLVAGHSGLAEVAAELERALPSAGPFSFEPGDGAVRRMAGAIQGRLERPSDPGERNALHRFAATRWSWERTAEALLSAGSRRDR